MNWALWRKAVSDAWLHLALSALLLFLFGGVFVWMMSHVPIGALGVVLRWIPDYLKGLISVPIADLATRTGQLTMPLVHPITLLVCIGWAVGRGSGSISGEIGRGTMDLLLSLPVRRVSVMAPPAVVAVLGAAALAAALWLGIAVGVWTIDLREPVAVARFVPGVVNLWAMTVALTGVTTFISSWNRDRWRTMALGGGFYVVSFLIEIVRRIWTSQSWLLYCTFLSAFRPQELILLPNGAALQWRCDGALLGLGLAAFVAAGAVLSRRDIPAAR